MKKFAVTLFIFTLFLFLIKATVVKAAPSNNPIFATIEEVKQMISDAISPILQTLNNHDERIINLENQVTDLQQRVSLLENPPTPTLTPTPTLPQFPGLDEDFNESTLNTDIWEVFPNSGTYYVSDGYLQIIGGNKPGMPFFRARNNPLPLSGSFTVEFGIQYTAVYPAGDGISLSINPQQNVTAGWDLNSPISLWQDNGGDGLSFRYFGNVGVTIGSNDLNYHVVKFIYDGDKYTAYLDGVLKYMSPSAPRASGLWFGHPYYSDLPGWTGFKIDYIKVTQP